MAEANIASPLTPYVTGSGGGESRRNSMENAGFWKSGENVVPNYLRASTGSCHDICKYGKKHGFGNNARLPASKRIGKKVSGDRNSVESLDLQQVKKTSAVKLTPTDSGGHASDTSKLIRGIVSSTSRLSDPARFKKPEEGSLSEKAREFTSKTKRASDSLKNVSSLKQKSPVDKMSYSSTDSGSSSGRRLSGVSDVKALKNVVTSKAAVKQTLASSRALLSPRSTSGNASLGSRKAGRLDSVSSLKKQNKVEKVDPELPPKDFTKKQTKVNNAEPQLPSNDLRESKSVALQEKNLYVINMEVENEVESDTSESCITESSYFPPSGSSSHGEEDQQESEWTESEAENDSSSENSEPENMDDVKNSEQVKLRFKRGKVVDIQTGHDSPRRLKFRQGRVHGEKQNSEALPEDDAKANDSDPSEEKVVLRHQDVQGKKEAQGLFNFVIEETASKLAESRKSKVKALVGAFETVISLQEKKPAANTAA